MFDLNPGDGRGDASGKVPLASASRARTILTKRDSSSLAFKTNRKAFLFPVPVTDVARLMYANKRHTHNKNIIWLVVRSLCARFGDLGDPPSIA